MKAILIWIETWKRQIDRLKCTANTQVHMLCIYQRRQRRQQRQQQHRQHIQKSVQSKEWVTHTLHVFGHRHYYNCLYNLNNIQHTIKWYVYGERRNTDTDTRILFPNLCKKKKKMLQCHLYSNEFFSFFLSFVTLNENTCFFVFSCIYRARCWSAITIIMISYF